MNNENIDSEKGSVSATSSSCDCEASHRIQTEINSQLDPEASLWESQDDEHEIHHRMKLFFEGIQADFSNFKFDREEANAR